MVNEFNEIWFFAPAIASGLILGAWDFYEKRNKAKYEKAKTELDAKYISQKEMDKKSREEKWKEIDRKEQEQIAKIKEQIAKDKRVRLEARLNELLPQVQAEIEEEKLNKQLSRWFGSLTETELNQVVKELPAGFDYNALARELADRLDYNITSKPIRREGEVQHHYKIAGAFGFIKSRVDAGSNLIAEQNNKAYPERNFILRSLAEEVYRRLEPKFLAYERAGDYAR